VTTKSQDAQGYFDQGLTLVYGFNHAEAVRSFREAARLDPDCAMAYWGQALALAPNINDSAIGPDREKQGHDAISEARKRKSHASAREQALINALAARFSGVKEPDRQSLNRQYAAAMEKVYTEYGEDADVAALYADAVMNTMPWNYWNKDGSPRPGVSQARSALEKALPRHINHAGLNHLYIHLMEASDSVDLAVPHADRLGSLVPGAGHLVHMPAHIYARVGRYADAAAVNVKAIAADEDYITQCRAQGIYPAAYYPHNIHFLNAALSMDGRSKEAIESARKLASHHNHQMMSEPGFAFAHLLKSIPILTMVRFGQWNEILSEPEPSADQVFGRAMRHFGRGFAFSALKQPGPADAELTSLRKLAADRSLSEMKIFDLNPLASLAQIALAMLEGEIHQASGRQPQAVASFRRAVQLEDGLLYSEPPDWMLPPRQYLANALMANGQLKEAEEVYRKDLNRHRANGWSLYGLEQSLRKQGRVREADAVKGQFQQAWARAGVQLRGSRF
jgi:tetratricopeptide (TPR) repeat protein